MDKAQLAELVKPIRDDLLSGAAEIALRAIMLFQTVLNEETSSVQQLKDGITALSRALVQAQPAMGASIPPEQHGSIGDGEREFHRGHPDKLPSGSRQV